MTNTHTHTHTHTHTQSIGIGSSAQQDMYKLLGAVLHLGNVELKNAGDGESSKVANPVVADRAARLLGTTKSALAKALTVRVVPAKGDVIETKMNQAKATYTRDALAKVCLACYSTYTK